jgi:hypothetical protein
MWVDGDDHTKQFRMQGDADKGRLSVVRPDLLDGDPVAYSPTEAKDRWSLPCARERARRPKDPLKSADDPRR